MAVELDPSTIPPPSGLIVYERAREYVDEIPVRKSLKRALIGTYLESLKFMRDLESM